jgi:thiamine-monophosphate kinase
MNEFELIDEITSHLEQQPNVLLGPGDDAAMLATPDGRVLASTDILIENVHFRQAWTTPYELGRRAAAQNFADIAAMGGVPTALLVGIAAPKAQEPQWFSEVARGMQDECDLVGASVIGGDLSASDRIMIAITVLGDMHGAAPVTRSGACVGDVVAVAGRLGWSVLGLAALETGADVAPELLAAYRAPTPPYAAGIAACAAGATAMIDVSDGLLADAGHIADASNVTIELDAFRLQPGPEVLAATRLLGLPELESVLTGGEDHALLATFPEAIGLPASFRPIGRVAARTGHAVLVDGHPYQGKQGHDHFG